MDVIGPGIFKEGGELTHQFGTLVSMKHAPHPNAARVFINWLLSRKGQLALQKKLALSESAPDSLRIDIPKDGVLLESKRIDGISYLDTGRPEWINMAPIYKVINEALGEAGKRRGG